MENTCTIVERSLCITCIYSLYHLEPKDQSDRSEYHWNDTVIHPELLHHNSMETFQDSLNTGCPLCVRAYESFRSQCAHDFNHDFEFFFAKFSIIWKIQPWRSKEYYYILWRFTLTIGEAEFCYRVEFRVRAVSDSITGIGPTGNETFHPSVTTTTATVDISPWLRECESSHACGKSSTRYCPPRLLDCQDSLHLVRREEIQENRVRYLTLSHCWGSKPIEAVLTTSNIEQYLNLISIANLPRTFRDAIQVARKIGIRYLWIDSLCIIQKGPLHLEDWQQHVSEMGKIYANCTLNVAAAHSHDSSGGIFSPRLHIQAYPCIISRPWLKTKELIRYNTSRLVSIECVAFEDLYTSRLHNRAWVFQERILSPRVVHFERSAVFWECNELTASDTYPNIGGGLLAPHLGFDGIPKWHTNMQSPRHAFIASQADDDYEHCWTHLAEDFQHLGITQYEDTFPAMSAIARLVNETYLHQRYIAGMFHGQLPAALLWKKVSPRKPLLCRGPGYIAPSWSWASVQAKQGELSLHWFLGWKSLKEVECIADIAHIELHNEKGHDEYGRLESAALAIRGQIRSTSVKEVYGKSIPYNTHFPEVFHIPWGKKRDCGSITVNWDAGEPPRHGQISLFCIYAVENNTEYTRQGLVLQRITVLDVGLLLKLRECKDKGFLLLPDLSNCFKRIGIFEVMLKKPNKPSFVWTELDMLVVII